MPKTTLGPVPTHEFGHTRGDRFVEIVLVIAREMPKPAVLDVDDVVRQLPDEIHIVADEDERSLELRERKQQRIHARQIEVRRRLVHEEQVGRIEK